jgi:hypothetical protein
MRTGEPYSRSTVKLGPSELSAPEVLIGGLSPVGDEPLHSRRSTQKLNRCVCPAEGRFLGTLSPIGDRDKTSELTFGSYDPEVKSLRLPSYPWDRSSLRVAGFPQHRAGRAVSNLPPLIQQVNEACNRAYAAWSTGYQLGYPPAILSNSEADWLA